MSGSVSLAPTNDRHDADRLIRFAVLSRIEILHILLEHSYDSQRKPERGGPAKMGNRASGCLSGGLLSSGGRRFQRSECVASTSTMPATSPK